MPTSSHLSSRISLNASLNTSLTKAKLRLSHYPRIRKIRDGTSTTYSLEIEGVQDRFYTFQITRDRLVVELNSKSSPYYYTKELILRTLSIVMILSDDYKADVGALIPYMVDILAKDSVSDRIPYPKNDFEAIDTVLSKRIIALLKQNNEMKVRLETLNSKSISILSTLILNKYSSGYRYDGIAAELGVDQDMISAAIKQLERLGYRALTSKGGTFEVIRA